jgi:hypothetical protein
MLYTIIASQLADILIVFPENSSLGAVSTLLVDKVVDKSLIRSLTYRETVADSRLLITCAP